jgi:hypothetical protein
MFIDNGRIHDPITAADLIELATMRDESAHIPCKLGDATIQKDTPCHHLVSREKNGFPPVEEGNASKRMIGNLENL